MNLLNSKSFLTRWTKFFLNRYRISILLLIAIVIAGIWGAANNQRQDFPDIPSNYIFIQSLYPGASPSDMEKEVAIPIEQAAAEIEGVASIRAQVGNSTSFVSVEMEDIPRTEKAATELNDKIGNIALPQDSETEIEVLKPAGQSMALAIVGYSGQSTNELLQYASAIQPKIEDSSSDIKSVAVIPENVFEIKILLSAEKITAANLSYDNIKSTIKSYITSLPGGQITTEAGLEKSINIKAATTTLEQLKNINLGRTTLGQVAAFERVPQQEETLISVGYNKNNNQYAGSGVYLLVEKKSKGDVINISGAIQNKIKEINKDNILPEDVDLLIAYDSAPTVQNQISSLLENGLYGLIIILVVLLFFINFRTALTVALIIPLAFLITLFLFPLLGYSLNILTLYAMILALGILVDNAIVIAEGIVFELEKGEKKFQASLNAVKKLGPSITAATLTTVIVFIPFASLGGLMGAFLKYIPYTLIIMVVSSYFLAVSITPLFGKWFSKEESLEERKNKKMSNWQKYLILPVIVRWGQQLINKVNHAYGRFMHWTLSCGWKKIVVVLTTVVLLGVSLGVFAPLLKFEQMPSSDTSLMTVNIIFPSGTPFEKKSDVTNKVTGLLTDLPYFESSYTMQNTIYGLFTEAAKRSDDTTMDDILDEFNNNLKTAKNEIADDITVRAEKASYGPPEPEYDIIVEFTGDDTDKLYAAVDDMENFFKNQDYIKKITHGPREESVPSVKVNLSQEKLSQQAVNPLAAAGTINAVFAEQKVGSIVVREDGVSDDLKIAFDQNSTNSLDDLKNLIMPSLSGRPKKLSEVAAIQEVNQPETIKRLDHHKVAGISVNLTDSEKRAAIQEKVENYLTNDKLIELGLEKDAVSYGGLFASFQQDYSNLQIIFILAVIMVYLILVYQFNSFSEPLLIIFAIPLALIGVFPGLYLVGSTLNMVSGLGVIALVGIVVNDAIVLISTFNRFKKESPDMSVKDLLIKTGQVRFKPVFSTSITTIAGIIILTIRDPFWTGLGTSIISGLIFATVGTLIIIPTLYSLFTHRKHEARLPQCKK